MPRHVGYSRRMFLKLIVGLFAVGGLGQMLRERRPAVAEPGADLSRYQEKLVQATDTFFVAIVKGNDPVAMVHRAVALAGGIGGVVKPGTDVLIKPNLTIPSASGLGNVTDSRVVAATIDICRQAGARSIVVGDGSGGGDTVQIMRQAGYESMLKAAGVPFLDFNTDEVVVARLKDADGLAEYSLAKSAAEATVLISLPVLKVHQSAIVSLACKNLIGIASRQVYGRPRQRLHEVGVQRVTADLVRLRMPQFAIVDGIVGLEGNSPMNGTPVPMNLIIAGRNPVSVDAVGSAVMGFDPRQIEQLSLLAKRGYGEIDPARIAMKGATIAEVQRKFRRE